MSLYLLEIGNSLAKVLEAALRAQHEQFAGYFANWEFWTAEFQHVRAVAEGYEQRFSAMATASNGYVARHGSHNLDDACTPYQGVEKTTKKQERNAVVAQCHLALEKWIARALKLELITITRHDDLLEIITKR